MLSYKNIYAMKFQIQFYDFEFFYWGMKMALKVHKFDKGLTWNQNQNLNKGRRKKIIRV